MRSYRPEELFDEDGALRAELAALAPTGTRRMSANPHANGGVLLRDLDLPDFRDYAVDVAGARRHDRRGDARARRRGCATSSRRNAETFRSSGRTRPRRTGSTPCSRSRTGPGGRDDPGRRPPRPGRSRDGGALGAPVPGLARGLPADRPPRPVQLLRGLHPHRRLDVQPAREVAQGHAATCRGGDRSRRSTTCCPRTSGARTTTASRTRTRASSTTWSTRRPRSSASICRPTRTRCSRSPTIACAAANYVNVIVAGQAAGAHWLSMDEAIVHCTRGIGIWDWASNDQARRAGRRDGLRRRRPDARGARGGRPPAPAPPGR